MYTLSELGGFALGLHDVIREVPPLLTLAKYSRIFHVEV